MKHSIKTLCLFSMLVVAASGSGCATFISTATDTAAGHIGTRIGERVGAAVVARFPNTWTTYYIQFYTRWLFTMAFHAGSYTYALREYQPGEWTRWQMLDAELEGKVPTMERAFLGELADGSEWWRVKYVNYPPGEEPQDIVLEGLFSPDGSQLLRLRGRFPGQEAQEMPVEEDAFGYLPPTELTAQSIEGATVGNPTIKVPAGIFQTRHVRYGTPQGAIEWWFSDRVPGGMIKYSHTARDHQPGEEPDLHHWALELDGYGANTVSELGVM